MDAVGPPTTVRVPSRRQPDRTSLRLKRIPPPGFLPGGSLQFLYQNLPPHHPAHGPGPISEQGEWQKGEPLVIGGSAAEITRKEDITQMKQEWEAMRAEKTAPMLATLSRANRVRAGC